MYYETGDDATPTLATHSRMLFRMTATRRSKAVKCGSHKIGEIGSDFI